MTSPVLFSPLTLRGLSLDNRIVVSPMCQYSADDGRASSWHTVHVPNLAMSGAALVFVEATAVEARGRITPGCLGLWSDAHEAALRPVVEVARAHGTAKLGIQLAHAGRKASCAVPWAGSKQLALDGAGAGGWETVAPAALPFSPGERAPRALDEAGLDAVARAFADAAARAARLGFDVVELHCAHGYLLHEFLSPLSNTRSDAWGGSRERRLAFPLRVFEAVRAAVPAERPVGVRISATDWIDGGWGIDDSVVFARGLKERGCDFIDCSSGGLSPDQKVHPSPGFQVPFAARIKRDVGIPTIAVGLITEAAHANAIVEAGEADLIALARGMLWNPRWGWHAAEKLGVGVRAPRQFLRAAPKVLHS